ncbi:MULTISPECIES: hypothetical protein [unclassified Duganella]|uniref:hypothetical protein n=1 Tax=unclassified Duganella TaxID=2636909 RepID=UPI00102A3830|nr:MULTISPECIES: hypothetical protein [unclassified Duganella]
MPAKAKPASAPKRAKKAKAQPSPLSPEHQKMWERQNEYFKKLREAPAEGRRRLTPEEIVEIGRSFGLWTKSGKLTASYKK